MILAEPELEFEVEVEVEVTRTTIHRASKAEFPAGLRMRVRM